MVKSKRIAVTGLGPLSAIGVGKDALWESILREESGLILDNYKIDGDEVASYYVHRLKGFNIKNFGINQDILNDIMIWKGQETATDLFYLLAVVKLALDDSRIEYADADKTKKIGLVLTHENFGLDQFYEEVINESYSVLAGNNKIKPSKKEYFQEFYKRFNKRGYELQTFMLPFHVAKIFNIHSYSIFLCNACASGLFAFETAADIIKSGKCNTVIVAGSDYTSIFKYLWFKGLGMYAEDGKIKPFAKDRNGFVTGDGGAGIVLEDLDHAIKRKAHIYAEYLGGGFDLEGWKISVPDINSDSYRKVILQALQRSNVAKEEIDLLVSHGIGTTVTDHYEAKAIAGVFGRNFQRPLVTAFKPYIGHNLGSTALLETVISILALENNYVPPILNTEEVDPRFKIQLVKETMRTNLNNVMKIACGFAGYNAACLFRKMKE